MNFHTDISRQSITIDGVRYTCTDATPSDGMPSRLQNHFRQEYGADSFHVQIADFLAEWFDGSDTLQVHTSGSTGTPKQLRVEKQRMMNSAMLTLSFLHLREEDTAMLCMPLQYIAGKMVVVRALVGGLNLIPVAPCGHPMQSLSQTPVFSAMIPMQVFNSLQVPEEAEKLSRIRHLIIGGGAVDEELGKQLHSFSHAVWSTYGMTETLSHIALRRINGLKASEWYTPFSNVSLTLSADQTLIIDAPLVSPIRLVTNDIVEFNPQGQFRILGRKDNTINTGGVKVQIEQVEARLKPLLPFAFQITAAPDSKFGEHIVLLVQSENPVTEENLHEAFRQLPPYWRPKQIICLPQLPLTGSGKPDRATARKIASSTQIPG